MGVYLNRLKSHLTAIWRRVWGQARGSVTMAIVWTCLAAFVLVSLLDLTGIATKAQIFEIFGLSYQGVVRRLWLHQYVTAALLHGGLMHLAFNLLTLWMLGPGVERILGRGRYLFFSLVCAGCGSTGFLLFDRGGNITMGYSGVIYGILVAQAVYFPSSILYFFGLFPMRMKHAVLVFGAIELYLTASPSGDGVAHAAHLFGALGAFVYLKLRAMRRPRRRWTMPVAVPSESIAIPEPPRLRDWGRPGELLIQAIGHGHYAAARQYLAQTRFPRKAARVAKSVKWLAASAERYAEDPGEQTEENMQSDMLSLWNRLMRKEMYGPLPALARLGLQYGDGIIPPIVDALCAPKSTGMPTSVRQSLESSLGEVSAVVLEHVVPQLTKPSTPARRVTELVSLLPALNLRRHAAVVMKCHGQADSRDRDVLVTRLSGIKEHSPGALCDLLAGALTRLPPDLRLARDLQAKVGLRELEKIASRWAAGGHGGAQTVLERLYEI